MVIPRIGGKGITGSPENQQKLLGFDPNMATDPYLQSDGSLAEGRDIFAGHPDTALFFKRPAVGPRRVCRNVGCSEALIRCRFGNKIFSAA
jgi:hypothetical protein